MCVSIFYGLWCVSYSCIDYTSYQLVVMLYHIHYSLGIWGCVLIETMMCISLLNSRDFGAYIMAILLDRQWLQSVWEVWIVIHERGRYAYAIVCRCRGIRLYIYDSKLLYYVYVISCRLFYRVGAMFQMVYCIFFAYGFLSYLISSEHRLL